MKDYKNTMFIAFALASFLVVGMARRINKDAAVGLIKKDAAAEKAFKEANAAEDSNAAPAMTVTEEEKAAKEASAAEDSNAAPAMTVAEAEEAEAEAAAESEAAAETEAAAESEAAAEVEAAVESSVIASSISGPSTAQSSGDGSQGLPSKIFQEPVSKVAVAAAIEEPVSKVVVAAAIGERASALQEDPEEATPSFDQQHFPVAGSSASSFLENSGVQGPPWRKFLAALGTSARAPIPKVGKSLLVTQFLKRASKMQQTKLEWRNMAAEELHPTDQKFINMVKGLTLLDRKTPLPLLFKNVDREDPEELVHYVERNPKGALEDIVMMQEEISNHFQQVDKIRKRLSQTHSADKFDRFELDFVEQAASLLELDFGLIAGWFKNAADQADAGEAQTVLSTVAREAAQAYEKAKNSNLAYDEGPALEPDRK